MTQAEPAGGAGELSAIIRRMIDVDGPLGLDRYMRLCLSHPGCGYYRTHQPIGAAGDFVTAPEISQMFGELIGLWAVDTWQRLGAPGSFHLVELGPGRGTLMADMLRAARLVPDFGAAARIALVETSPALRRAQATTLSGQRPDWFDHVDAVPDGPAIIVANEFFDALPIRQFAHDGAAWRERCIGRDPETGHLCFGLGPPLSPPGRRPPGNPQPGTVLEWHGEAADYLGRVAGRLARSGGAALILDYGYERPAFGETFQALHRHRPADPLAAPGTADLTAHVDFSHLADRAREAGLAVAGPIDQGTFLLALGLDARAAALTRTAPDRAEEISGQHRRLADPAEMGTLFKALAVTGHGFHPAGFPEADTP